MVLAGSGLISSAISSAERSRSDSTNTCTQSAEAVTEGRSCGQLREPLDSYVNSYGSPYVALWTSTTEKHVAIF
jgi:hypothetical protein